jgi:hypothetical protein
MCVCSFSRFVTNSRSIHPSMSSLNNAQRNHEEFSHRGFVKLLLGVVQACTSLQNHACTSGNGAFSGQAGRARPKPRLGYLRTGSPRLP